MKENKNIERLFQEKFKDFEAIPPQNAWNNIEARLNKKENKKRIIPFWFKSTGIAALLLMSVYFIINNTKSNIIINDNENNGIVNTSNEDASKNSKNDDSMFNGGNFKGKIIKANEVVTENNNVQSINENDLNTNNKSTNRLEQIVNANTNSQVQVENNLKTTKKSNNNSSINKTTNPELLFNRKEEGIVSTDNTKLPSKAQKESVLNTNNKLLNVDADGSSTIAKNDKKENKTGIIKEEKSSSLIFNNQINSEDLVANGVDVKKNNSQKQNSIITQNESISQELNSENLVENNSKNNTTVTSKIDSVLVQSVLAENQLEVKEDSTLVANLSKEENVLEQLLKEKEEGKNADEKEKEKRNKWAVSSNAAPVYFNSMSNGSPLGEDFAENDKSYNTSLSYGLGLQYDVTKKLSIKTGVNSLDFSYKTNNVYYLTSFNSIDSKSIHIDGNTNAKNILLYSKRTPNQFGVVESFTQERKGEINQQISYIEVPLELSYKLLNRKFGIDLVGGMSTLFLSNNAVSLVSNGLEMEIGKANNLNNIHFSSNVGLGFKYTFWKSFQANFQPMFKYQINTFSEDAGNFKPYFIGLYSGLSFSF